MIKVIYYRGKHRLTVEGHANSGESGRDLVCASASILTYTLASFVSNMAEAGQLKSKGIKLDEGNARINCSPQARHEAAVTLVFDSICGGFELLAKNYPEYVKYEIMPN